MSPPIRLLGLFELLTATALGLAACGGGSAGMGQLKMALADAPVDGAQAVVVKFTGIELTGNGGNPVDITFTQPKTIDLLNQSGTASAVLFDQPVPAGSYGQIRLIVVADGNPCCPEQRTAAGGACRPRVHHRHCRHGPRCPERRGTPKSAPSRPACHTRAPAGTGPRVHSQACDATGR